jgi:hypothetical protein
MKPSPGPRMSFSNSEPNGKLARERIRVTRRVPCGSSRSSYARVKCSFGDFLPRDLTVYLGDPYQFATDQAVAVTFAPVPSFKKFTNLAEVHPYPWLRMPHAGSVRSFSSWRKNFPKTR